MPKGDIVTTIPSGKPLKISWHLGYPHQGGVTVELLDANDRLLLDLSKGIQGTGEKTVRVNHVAILGFWRWSLFVCDMFLTTWNFK
jgi:hypothetical protein